MAQETSNLSIDATNGAHRVIAELDRGAMYRSDDEYALRVSDYRMLSRRSLVEREAEFDICVYQIIECEAPVATAGVWQDPRLNVSDPYRLASPTNVCDIHHRRT